MYSLYTTPCHILENNIFLYHTFADENYAQVDRESATTKQMTINKFEYCYWMLVTGWRIID